MNDKQYHDQEMTRLYRKMAAIEAEPAKEQAESAATLLESMIEVKWMVEKADWIVYGNYGYAEQFKAKQILSLSKRANKAAQLCQLTAALEYGVKSATVRKLWHKLTPEQQTALNAAFQALIDDTIAAETELTATE